MVIDRPLAGRRGCFRGHVGGEPVDVTVIALPPDAAVRRAALAALQPLVGLGGGSLPRCRAAMLCHDGVALVADAVSGTSPAAVTAGQGSAVAQALLTLHRRGIGWGSDLRELVDDEGALRLPYEHVARRRVEGRPSPPVRDVGALLAWLSPRCHDDRLRPLVARPPTDLTAVVKALRARDRRWVAVPVAVVAVVAAAAIGWVSARPSVARPAVTALPDWRVTVHELDAARAAALSGHGSLTDVDASGSPAAVTDARTVAELRARGLTAIAPVPALLSVLVAQVDPTSATLRVTDTLAGYAYRDGAGQVVATAAARGPHVWTVTLVRTSGGWRYRSVS
jgi:hypothetical protein